MRTWALVPLKSLAQAKKRLEPAIGPETRRALVLAMAADVLAALAGVDSIAQTLIVSNEPEAGSLLGDRHLDVFYSADTEGLNRELEQAAAYAASQGAERVLILHADLPWLHADRLSRFIEESPAGGVRAAQDKAGTGTNAILSPLPLPLPLVFGADSLAAFRAEAAAHAVELDIVADPGLSYDIDDPDDLARLIGEGADTAGPDIRPGPATRELADRIGRRQIERTA